MGQATPATQLPTVKSAKECIRNVGPKEVDVGNGRTRTVFRSIDEVIEWKRYCAAQDAAADGKLAGVVDLDLDYSRPNCPGVGLD